jgi:hypothetical protein
VGPDGNAGEVDVICARDNTVLVLELKSTYLRRSRQDAWQHETTTLRKAGRQLHRKVAAVQQALTDQPELAQALGVEMGAPATTLCGWIVDTSIECDHQRFGGFLKLSLEELLIPLQRTQERPRLVRLWPVHQGLLAWAPRLNANSRQPNAPHNPGVGNGLCRHKQFAAAGRTRRQNRSI